VKVHELPIEFGSRVVGGLALIPYQVAIGLSLRWWCTGPAIRLYLGPLKLWLSVIRNSAEEATSEDAGAVRELQAECERLRGQVANLNEMIAAAHSEGYAKGYAAVVRLLYASLSEPLPLVNSWEKET